MSTQEQQLRLESGKDFGQALVGNDNVLVTLMPYRTRLTPTPDYPNLDRVDQETCINELRSAAKEAAVSGSMLPTSSR
jgi:hypothetical protein